MYFSSFHFFHINTTQKTQSFHLFEFNNITITLTIFWTLTYVLLLSLFLFFRKGSTIISVYGEVGKQRMLIYGNHHCTVDFRQSVSLPHYFNQMGPLYFLFLRKIHDIAMTYAKAYYYFVGYFVHWVRMSVMNKSLFIL